jgi:hypothetical protein
VAKPGSWREAQDEEAGLAGDQLARPQVLVGVRRGSGRWTSVPGYLRGRLASLVAELKRSVLIDPDRCTLRAVEVISGTRSTQGSWLRCRATAVP